MVASPNARWLSLSRFCSSRPKSGLSFIIARLMYTLAIIIWSRIKRTVESAFSFSFSFLQILYLPNTAESTDFERSMAAFSSFTVTSSSCFTKSAARFSRRFCLSCCRMIKMRSKTWRLNLKGIEKRLNQQKKNVVQRWIFCKVNSHKLAPPCYKSSKAEYIWNRKLTLLATLAGASITWDRSSASDKHMLTVKSIQLQTSNYEARKYPEKPYLLKRHQPYF